MIQTAGLQAATNACDQEVVAPRKRQRTRGATKKKDPEALASGNGHSPETIPAVCAPRKSRRKYNCISVGPASDLITFRFPVGEPLPSLILKARKRDYKRQRWPIVAGHKFIYGPPKGTKPENLPTPEPVKFLASLEERRAWYATLPQGKIQPKPKPLPVPEQWFRVELPDMAMQNRWWNEEHDWEDVLPPPDARENFPQGWCCRLVQPQPKGDRDWIYIQLPEHYFVFGPSGQTVCKTDHAGDGKVECGMRVPRWLLKPIKLEEAVRIYNILEIQKYWLQEYPDFTLEEAERYFEMFKASRQLKNFLKTYCGGSDGG